jgi:alpha-galactosidase
VFVQDLVVRAALQADRERVYRAAVLDRHAASVLRLFCWCNRRGIVF